ncbi:unknown similar to AMEVITR04 [Choristoneura biennis entomopoxvirus]|uniref:Uncharacterized protein n=1 Tax=Choristoneura biennis entomopoxvirus TaxID=10288 RepID=A0A916KQ26_CBEPV|nr:unknown similar to AMEVITR04 [Choristoneura biennis entomopoxvirus]YP_008004384.1 unknown similar to AMEVITR04 [Choristoneura biennis entomopoxvirus]CCU55589.1 unknown similar to AMEVITR04 [Choristoneura biennis entomopoxvirus]CCU55882.1 unknown similar to AMEVITR04 [Choristoneura biennis entomopoxvirus]
MTVFWLSILLLISFTLQCEYRHSKYFCHIYYECVNDKSKIKSCKNNTVRYVDECITQNEYKNNTGNYCSRCVKNILLPGIHYDPIICNKLSNYMCCFEENDFIIYCTEQNGDYYWIKDYYKDCNSVLENRRF